MTPQGSELKKAVGIRELHDQLSRYVRNAAEGGEVVVTMRGLPVARLLPIGSDDPLADLKKRGLVRESKQEWSPSAETRPRARGGSVADLVRDQRR